jgi:hypothetical protein
MSTTPDAASPAVPPLRSIADQSIEELGGPTSVLRRQQRDHEELDRLLLRLATTFGTAQEDVLNQLARLVFPHAFAEESVLWPAARRVLDDGPQLTLEIEQEHQQINELWRQLENTRPNDPRRGPLLEQIAEHLENDVREEEDDLLPRLQQRLSPAELRRLGVAWEIVRRTAPTRPHPVVARRPPGNVVAALPLTVTDRLRDRLDAVSRRTGGQVSVAARAASTRLAGIASVIERIPPLPRGEHPSTNVPARHRAAVADGELGDS